MKDDSIEPNDDDVCDRYWGEPMCIDCNDQDEQVWDEETNQWKCERCAITNNDND